MSFYKNRQLLETENKGVGFNNLELKKEKKKEEGRKLIDFQLYPLLIIDMKGPLFTLISHTCVFVFTLDSLFYRFIVRPDYQCMILSSPRPRGQLLHVK